MTQVTSPRRRGLSPAVRRYQVRFWVLMAAYLVLLAGWIWLMAAQPPEGALRYALAVLPTIPVVAMVANLGLYLKEEADEFARFFTVLSMLCATAVTLAVTTVWGFLEWAGAPHLSPSWVFPIFGVSMGLSMPLIWWRYR